MRQREDMRKNPFWYFWSDRLWLFNFQDKIFKSKYLGFCSSDWKTKDSSRKQMTERVHGENPILIFWVFHLWKSLWLFNFQFGCWAKSSNHIILVSAHLILKLKIVLESSWSREFMVRNSFLYFEFFTSGNPCDSSTSPKVNF